MVTERPVALPDSQVREVDGEALASDAIDDVPRHPVMGTARVVDDRRQVEEPVAAPGAAPIDHPRHPAAGGEDVVAGGGPGGPVARPPPSGPPPLARPP